MNTDEERCVTAKDRKLFKLRTAVKCNWNKTNWQLKNNKKLLEDKLKSYQEQKRQSIRLFELRKCKLEKRFMETKMAKTKAKDESEKNEKIVNEDLRTQTETTRTHTSETGRRDRNKNKESNLIVLDEAKLSWDDRQKLLPGRRILARQSSEHTPGTCPNRDTSKGFSRKLSDGDGIRGERQAGSRKMNWWESVAYESEQDPLLPEIVQGTQKEPLVFRRSASSYTVGEKSNIWIPARERKKGVYRMQSILRKDCIQKLYGKETPSCEDNFNLEELFEQLQNCRYLRPAGPLN